mgnify:CR=1 FL=1
MLRKRLFPVIALILIAFPLIGYTRILAQQDDPCRFNLSQLVAGLVEAQAAASSGEPAGALPVLRAAAEALTILADRCEASLSGAMATDPGAVTVTEVTPEATVAISVPGVFVASNGAFTINYPPEWIASDFLPLPPNNGAVTIGSTAESLTAINTQSPVMTTGQQGLQIIVGTGDDLTNFELNQATLEEMLGYFIGTFERTYPEIGTPETVTVADRTVGRLTFGGESFDAVLYLVELEPMTRFAVIAGIGAKGERDALIPIVEAAVSSLE